MAQASQGLNISGVSFAENTNVICRPSGEFVQNILFLCSKNKLRSPTAEALFCNIDGWNVYSAGISNDAEVQVSLEDIEWSDYIFVMENAHKMKLSKKFGAAINGQPVISLDIPDNYEYMDEALIGILKSKVPRHVK